MLTLPQKPEIPKNIFHKQKGTLHLIIHPKKPSWLILNDFGWELVQCFLKKMDMEEIVIKICTRYNKKPKRVVQDIKTYIFQLSKAGFIHDNWIGKKTPASIQLKMVHINIIEKCNLKCLHCAVIDSLSSNHQIKKESVFKIVDELSTNQETGIAFSGGEPLLHKDYFEILEYASQRMNTSLSTNGTLIKDDVAQKLSSLGIDIQLSLDGATPPLHDHIRGSGSFEKVIKAIELLKHYNKSQRISIVSTIMKSNVTDLHKIIKLAEDLGIHSVRFLPLQRIGYADKLWDELSPTKEQYIKFFSYIYRELPQTTVNINKGLQGFVLNMPDNEERWCKLGKAIVVGSNGDIYPCALMVYPEYRLGNIKEMSMKEVSESKKLKELINLCSDRENKIIKCKECLCRAFCQGNCSGSIFALMGTIWNTDDLCEFRQNIYPDLIFDMIEKKTSLINSKSDC